MSLTEKYIYLDGKEEREQLIQNIQNVRQEFMKTVAQIPESMWYTPRYHGWSLAAMIAHLNLVDNLAMVQIRAGLLGIRPKMGPKLMHRMNNWSSRLFRRRVIESSLASIPVNEERILKLIQNVPMASFSKTVYLPTADKYITVEQALQYFFLHHWQEHLQTVHHIESKQTSDADGSTE